MIALSPQPDFVFVLGDLVNFASPKATGVTETSNLQYWKTFMTTGVTPWVGLGSIPIYVAVGNSDLYGTDTWWTQAALQTAFATFVSSNNLIPSTLAATGPTTPVDYTNLTYSFEVGTETDKTLFVVLDSFGTYGTTHLDNDFDTELVDWFTTQANASSAYNHKFVFSHGPAFSSFGYTIGSKVATVWDLALNNNFETFFCAHEHIFRRWNKYPASTPDATKTLVQCLTGCAGASPSNLSSITNPENRIYSGYNYVIVDVDGNNVIEKAYKVESDGAGGYTSQPLDTLIISK